MHAMTVTYCSCIGENQFTLYSVVKVYFNVYNYPLLYILNKYFIEYTHNYTATKVTTATLLHQ